MGAHSTTGTTGPTGLRIVTTTLAIAATSVLGSGTALAHDDGGHHGEQHSTAAEHAGHHGYAGSDDAMDDLLAEVGMSSWDPSGESSGDSVGDDEGSDETGDDASVTRQVAAPAPARPATSTQPIAAPASTVPAELPAPGETQTIPIRGNR